MAEIAETAATAAAAACCASRDVRGEGAAASLAPEPSICRASKSLALEIICSKMLGLPSYLATSDWAKDRWKRTGELMGLTGVGGGAYWY